jgi:hypothetical protein
LPKIVLIPKSLTSGCRAARRIAKASSWPVSQSSQIGVGLDIVCVALAYRLEVETVLVLIFKVIESDEVL